MACEPEKLVGKACVQGKSDPPVLSDCKGNSRSSESGSNQDIEDSAAPYLLPFNVPSVGCVEEVVSDSVEHEKEKLNEKSSELLPNEDSLVKTTSVPPYTHHRKKKRDPRQKSGNADEPSGNSGTADSLAGLRSSDIEFDPLLITLSSESCSDSDTKMDNLDNENNKPVVDPGSGKRMAHINAELIRKFSAIHWSRDRKRANEKGSDSSASNSAAAKVKKCMRAKKSGTLASQAAFTKRKYFRSCNMRHSCLDTRKKILQPFACKTSPLKRGVKRRNAVNLQIDMSKKSSNSSPRSRNGQTLQLGSAERSHLVRKRGRPRKYLPGMIHYVKDNTSKQCVELSEAMLKQNSETFQRTVDDNKSQFQGSLSRTHSTDDDSEKKVSSDKALHSDSSSTIVKKRGRPKLSEVERQRRLKKNFINRKVRPILQNGSCFDVAPKLPKCRECRIAAYNKSKKNQNSYCRFFEYRKLCFAKNGTVINAGFSQPTESTEEDLRMWLPSTDHPPKDLTLETSKALLVQVGDQFCDLIEQEKEALSLHIGTDKTVTWKKIVQGVREMCDVCDTTLFNIHWVCPKCGLAVCIDCYKVRKQGIVVENAENRMKGQDEYLWLLCNGRQPHEQDKLIMTQIVPAATLWTMQDSMHHAREMWNIAAYCRCKPQEVSCKTKKHVPTGICKQLMCSVSKSFIAHTPLTQPSNSDLYNEKMYRKSDVEISDSAMKWLNNVNENEHQFDDYTNCQSNRKCYNQCYESYASLKNILLQGNPEPESCPGPPTFSSFTLDDVINCVIETKVEKSKGKLEKDTIKLFNHRYPQPNSGRDPLPIRIFTTTESSLLYAEVPHSWLCNGRLLLLHKPQHHKNLELFQEQWKRGQPIMVMGVDKQLDMSLWHPDGFCRDFGEIKNDLVNCKTGAIIPNLPMKRFWEGFENFEKRMKDESGQYMLLKLKDWPPGEDFSEKLPKRFQDLMNGLPLPQYTHRNGIFNLAGRLPHWFVRPDLGPKMYNAYGSALYPSKGTTNLHLDVSDAVNVMVYVGVPHDGKDENHIQEALKAIDDGGCDSLMRERVRSRGVRPGALWHIYNARDTDKIRDMLSKVAMERGEKLEAHHDPIHDQSWYIDTELRKRLYHEYGVEGYAIAQCLGDAVFIPAGAPHQVRNLQSCVKVAEDFVSPENIAHCFKLTQEFRHLSDTHTNHEDKLQIKNIIYHVVKDALSHLLNPEAVEMHHCYNL